MRPRLRTVPFAIVLAVLIHIALAGVASGTLVLPTISVTDVDKLEGNAGASAAVFTVSLSSNPASTVTVAVATANSTAMAGSDYVALPATTLTWNPGDPLAKAVSVAVKGDSLKEGNEAFFLNLSSPSGATLADAQGVGTIIDEEGRFFLTVDNPSVVEGDSGTTTMDFHVSVSAAPAAGQRVTVKVTTAGGTATAGVDYVALPLTQLVWKPGDPLAKTVPVTVNGDTTVETNENFEFQLLSASTNAQVSAFSRGTIVNDDGTPSPPPPPSIGVTDVDVLEGNSGTTTATFVVFLEANPSTTTTVDVHTENVQATAGSDYVAVPTTTLTWNPGDPLAKTVNVTVNGDTLKEGMERFLLVLTPPSTVIPDPIGVATIIDEEGRFFVSVSDAAVVEGNVGTTTANFAVRLSAPPAAGQQVTVKVATADGTATAGSGDYVAVPTTTLTWNPGDPLTTTVAVTVNSDTSVEPDETFQLKVVKPSFNAAVSDARGTGIILNDD